jgi:hypothetical protein
MMKSGYSSRCGKRIATTGIEMEFDNLSDDLQIQGENDALRDKTDARLFSAMPLMTDPEWAKGVDVHIHTGDNETIYGRAEDMSRYSDTFKSTFEDTAPDAKLDCDGAVSVSVIDMTGVSQSPAAVHLFLRMLHHAVPMAYLNSMSDGFVKRSTLLVDLIGLADTYMAWGLFYALKMYIVNHICQMIDEKISGEDLDQYHKEIRACLPVLAAWDRFLHLGDFPSIWQDEPLIKDTLIKLYMSEFGIPGSQLHNKLARFTALKLTPQTERYLLINMTERVVLAESTYISKLDNAVGGDVGNYGANYVGNY